MRTHFSLILLVVACIYGQPLLVIAQSETPAPPTARLPALGIVPFDADSARQLQDAWAKHLSSERVIKTSLGMQLILIPPGKFQLQGEDAIVAAPFYLGQTEVTQAEWTAVMGTTPWKDKAKDGEFRPATFITWNDARAFCERLTNKEKQGTYRLPTEEEWEFACRAGTNTKYNFGDDASLLGKFAWTSDNTKKVSEAYAHDVALKKPNAFGLFDMHGNVWEWCDGYYHIDFTKEERPKRAKTGIARMIAGGSWNADLSHLANHGSAYAASNAAFYCRSDSRSCPIPTLADNATGFRVAWIPPAK